MGNFTKNLRANGGGDDICLCNLLNGISAVAMNGAYAVNLFDARIFTHDVDLIALLVSKLIDQRLVYVCKSEVRTAP